MTSFGKIPSRDGSSAYGADMGTRWKIGLAAAALFAGGVGIGLEYVSTSSEADAAAELSGAADACRSSTQKAVRLTPEQERDMFAIEDDGRSISVTRSGGAPDVEQAQFAMRCIVRELGGPDRVLDAIATGGGQHDSFGRYRASWTADRTVFTGIIRVD